MHRNAPAYFTLDFTREKSDETVIVIYLSDPSTVIGAGREGENRK